MSSLTEIARFCAANFYHGGDIEILRDWFMWHASHGMAATTSESGKLTGVLCWRPVSKVPELDDFYSVDQAGRIVWIELIIATKPGVLSSLWQKVRQSATPTRFDFIAARRRKYSNRVRVRPYAKVDQLMLGET